MNLVGKIFVVLIFIMSLVFATFSIMVYATHKNWKDEILRTPAEVRGNQSVGWKERLTQARAENAKLREERNQYELRATAERTAKIQALARAEAQIANLQQENATQANELKAKEAALLASTNAYKDAQENLSRFTREVMALRDRVAETLRETDENIKKATTLSDKLAAASGLLAVLKERNEQLSADVVKAKALLGNRGVTLDDPVDGSTIPVAGVIRGVSRTKVELSVGTDDGIRKDQDLDVYRGDRYVGRVRVIDVQSDKAVATILPEYQQIPIQRGDNVNSRLGTL